MFKKGKRKVQGVTQSQTATLRTNRSTKISSLFPKRGNRNTKRTEKHKNKMTHGKTYNKSPRRINHKATKSKTNTGTTALERLKALNLLKVLSHTSWGADRTTLLHLYRSLIQSKRLWVRRIWIC